MDRLDAMSLFLEVVDSGSMSAAGRKLGIPLATVSRRISELETHLKTRLLSRSTRKINLTEAGHVYLKACNRILEDVHEAERIAAGEYVSPKGELIVTAPFGFGRLHLLPVIVDFLDTQPDINVRLILADKLNHLLEEHIDIALRIGDLPDSSMIASQVGVIRHVFCASPQYLASRGIPLHPEQLSAHECITFDSLVVPGHWPFGPAKDRQMVPIKERLTVNHAEAAIDAAIAGVGIARVLSYQCAEAVRSGALVLLLEAFEPHPWPVHLVHMGKGVLPLKTRAFLDFAAPRLRKRIPQA